MNSDMIVGLILTVFGGVIVGWNLRSLWMAWKSRRFCLDGLEPGDKLELFSANGESEAVTVTAVKRTTITVSEDDSKRRG